MNRSKYRATVNLTRQAIQKSRVLGARRATSLGGLLAEQIETLLGEDEAGYEREQRQAMALLDRDFHLGGMIRANRDELHER
jgi:hypothetical protein